MTLIAEQIESQLKSYFIFTMICVVFDFVEFIIQLVRFGHIGKVRLKLIH